MLSVNRMVLLGVLALSSLPLYAASAMSGSAAGTAVSSAPAEAVTRTLDDLLKARADAEQRVKDQKAKEEAQAVAPTFPQGALPSPTGVVPGAAPGVAADTETPSDLKFVATGMYGAGGVYTLEGAYQGRLYALSVGDTLDGWTLQYITLKGALFVKDKERKIIRVTYPTSEKLATDTSVNTSTSPSMTGFQPPAMVAR